MTSQSPVRVAIVGGGCAGLTTAFELTRPEHRGRYEVTVYQMGWRLGGKGASGRGVADRIEEHGLHLWMGFYENAFRLMRECYAERRRVHPGARFADWRDAFAPMPDVGVADCTPGGWEFWLAHFPPGHGDPGDPPDGSGPFTVRGYLRQSAILIGELLRSAGGSGRPPVGEARSTTSAPDVVATAVETLFRYGELATTAAFFEACDLLRQLIDFFVPGMPRDATALPLRLVEAMADGARRRLSQIVAGDSGLRRIWHVIDLILATIRGSIVEGLVFDSRGFDAINHYDWREWLRRHGAAEESLQSGFMRAIYDLVFAFEDGDVTKPRLAAGVALRGAMRMFFTYRGALFWRMNAGMGDVVFAPLYQVLCARGVRFEFFHRLRNVSLAPPEPGDTQHVQALEFDVQARVKGGTEYQPLVDVHGVPSWPAVPDYRQLVNGRKLEREGRAFERCWDRRRVGRKTLRVSKDFDIVVLGVSVGVLPEVASELIAADVRWRDMVHHVKTVPTQALQIWLRESIGNLGWPHGPVNLSGFVEPFDTWADTSHLLVEESWPTPVRSIAYFCSVLPGVGEGDVTEEDARTVRERVRAEGVQFLDRQAGTLWPKAATPDGFRWELLARADGKDRHSSDSHPFDSQYWTANVNPSDRYVLSLPGSPKYRISPLDRTFDNLTIAGDWTASGLDSGCIESAVMSGRLAAHAIALAPRLDQIVGYDHP